MITASRQGRVRRQTTALLSLTALAVLLPVSACSSGGSAAASGTSDATTAAQAACQQVTAVLTDGPDPGTDPVGYAQAQVLPLRQIRTPNAPLTAAIATLASAYSTYATANGASKAATATLNAAISKINALCPGAGASL